MGDYLSHARKEWGYVAQGLYKSTTMLSENQALPTVFALVFVFIVLKWLLNLEPTSTSASPYCRQTEK